MRINFGECSGGRRTLRAVCGWAIGFGLLVLLGLGFAAPANAQVVDRAGLFNQATVSKADAIIASLQAKTGKQLLVETYPAIPPALAASYEPAQKGIFFEQWAVNIGRQQHVNGVVVLICRKPGHLTVQAGAATLQSVFFSAQRDRAAQMLLAAFKASHFNTGLISTANYIAAAIESRVAAVRPAAANAPMVVAHPRKPAKSYAAVWFILIIVGAIMLWLVFRRRPQQQPMYSSGGGLTPGAGGGTAPMGGVAGGSGMGSSFVTGLVGGAIGAAAGNMMYDAMRGSGSNAGAAPPVEPSAGAGAGDPNAGGDFSANVPADTASDWSTGDANSGGDFGGGGDTGGTADNSDVADSGGGFDDSGGGDDSMDNNSGGDF